MSEKIFLYSDGACEGNPGRGGYGSILKYKEAEKTFSKGFQHTTNNRMELLGIIEPLEKIESIKKFSDLIISQKITIHIISDSQYVVKAINEGWVKNWTKNNWKKSDNKPVLNKDLWERLLSLLEKYNLTFEWVKGHNSNEYNNKCDILAVSARKENNLEIDENYKK